VIGYFFYNRLLVWSECAIIFVALQGAQQSDQSRLSHQRMRRSQRHGVRREVQRVRGNVSDRFKKSDVIRKKLLIICILYWILFRLFFVQSYFQLKSCVSTFVPLLKLTRNGWVLIAVQMWKHLDYSLECFRLLFRFRTIRLLFKILWTSFSLQLDQKIIKLITFSIRLGFKALN